MTCVGPHVSQPRRIEIASKSTLPRTRIAGTNGPCEVGSSADGEWSNTALNMRTTFTSLMHGVTTDLKAHTSQQIASKLQAGWCKAKINLKRPGVHEN